MGSMFPIHGTSSTLYVSILETLQICTLYFVMNKVLISIICLYSFSPLCFNLHIWSLSTTILHTDLQYKNRQPWFHWISSPNRRPRFCRISFSKSPKLSPNGFLQNCLTISPNRRHIFAENRRISFLQITEHVSSKSPTYLATRFLQTAEHFTLNLQDISPISEQPTFFSVLFGEDPVSDLSLHVPRAPRSALWVVGYGSLVTPVSPTRARAPRSTLWTMSQPRPRAQLRTNCSDAAYTVYISKLFQ